MIKKKIFEIRKDVACITCSSTSTLLNIQIITGFIFFYQLLLNIHFDYLLFNSSTALTNFFFFFMFKIVSANLPLMRARDEKWTTFYPLNASFSIQAELNK